MVEAVQNAAAGKNKRITGITGRAHNGAGVKNAIIPIQCNRKTERIQRRYAKRPSRPIILVLAGVELGKYLV